MAVSELYQFIWEHGVEIPEAPGWAYASVEQILCAHPQLTEKRLAERGKKSPYMSYRVHPDGERIIGWFIHVPPQDTKPTKHRRRFRAPLPQGETNQSAHEKQMILTAQRQRERVRTLGWMCCIPTEVETFKPVEDADE